MGSHMNHNRGTGLVESLRDEFREHLAVFYSRLKLAAPYDTVEKALGSLTTAVADLRIGGDRSGGRSFGRRSSNRA